MNDFMKDVLDTNVIPFKIYEEEAASLQGETVQRLIALVEEQQGLIYELREIISGFVPR